MKNKQIRMIKIHIYIYYQYCLSVKINMYLQVTLLISNITGDEYVLILNGNKTF